MQFIIFCMRIYVDMEATIVNKPGWHAIVQGTYFRCDSRTWDTSIVYNSFMIYLFCNTPYRFERL